MQKGENSMAGLTTVAIYRPSQAWWQLCEPGQDDAAVAATAWPLSGHLPLCIVTARRALAIEGRQLGSADSNPSRIIITGPEANL